MKKKTLVTSVLALALAASVALPSIVGAEYEDFEGRTSGKKTTETSFNVDPGYGYVKLWFKNNRKNDVTITVKNIDTGKKYLTTTIKPGKEYTWRSVTDWKSKAVGAGEYKITYRDGNGGSVNVDYAGFSSNDEDEGRDA
ncbi:MULTISPECIES: hypothetical protein [unclassified Bacillus (in: firmicutes)]|uniref:hypothetical protein n=1 Tax=unclassified Bacillus (in: firmicutes) TaxID=185979 RepID=UPI0008EE8420|nr:MULTISPECIES: hypothetical protein [unclassified Bacillus (in: firmicutes)]SFK08554.1 hypothetical protein SAMN04488574_1537 [Bacillus sp. 71mf]SFT23380.1 hypothetical protein SAMN04488145_1297 [Bacillus sp. 103mf]